MGLEPARMNQPAWANVAASSAPALSSCGAEALKPCAGVYGLVCIIDDKEEEEDGVQGLFGQDFQLTKRIQPQTLIPELCRPLTGAGCGRWQGADTRLGAATVKP